MRPDGRTGGSSEGTGCLLLIKDVPHGLTSSPVVLGGAL